MNWKKMIPNDTFLYHYLDYTYELETAEDFDEDVIKFAYNNGIGYTTEYDLQNMLDKSDDHFWFTDDIKNIANGKVKYGWTLPLYSVKKFFGFDEFTDRVTAYQAKLNNSNLSYDNEIALVKEFFKL